MCIAIWKDKDLTISKERLQECFNSNPDGAGFMYIDNKQLKMQKGFFKFNDFWEAYEPLQSKKCVIHFRIKTHGAINVDNCHPFEISPALGFVHNGVISGYGEGDISDTRDFNNLILKPMVAKWGNLALFEPAIKHLIEERIGYSKLIFLDKQGKHNIFNEEKGVWDEDVWYSNTSYKTKAVVVPTQSNLYGKQSYQYYPTYVKPPLSGVATAAKSGVQPSMVVKEGELIRLVAPHYDVETKTLHKRGDILEVIAVNMDYTADLMSDTTDAIAYNVPFAKMDFYDEDYEINRSRTADAWADSTSNWLDY